MRKQRTVRRIVSTIGCLAIGIGIGRAFAPGGNLYINGALASNHVFDHNGSACVPITDVAKALNQTVVPRPDGFAITAAGGANQVSGVTGKVGDKLTNGQFTLTVLKVIRTDHYKKQFDTGDATADPGKEIVEVVCRVKNATAKSLTLFVFGGNNTNLTDQDEHAFEPGPFNSDFANRGASLLPGAAVDFALGFAIPKGTKLGDFVYQISAGGATINLKETNFRVSMASANP